MMVEQMARAQVSGAMMSTPNRVGTHQQNVDLAILEKEGGNRKRKEKDRADLQRGTRWTQGKEN